MICWSLRTPLKLALICKDLLLWTILSSNQKCSSALSYTQSKVVCFDEKRHIYMLTEFFIVASPKRKVFFFIFFYLVMIIEVLSVSSLNAHNNPMNWKILYLINEIRKWKLIKWNPLTTLNFVCLNWKLMKFKS